MVSSCMLFGGCRVWFSMHRPYCTLDRRRYGLRMMEMLQALSASWIFPLWLQASLPQTFDWLFSLMSTSLFGSRPPAAMIEGWFSPLHAAFSAGLCNDLLEHRDHTVLLGAHLRRLLWSCMCLPSLRHGQPSAAALEARWTPCWADWLSWGLLRLTRCLAIWCQGWSANSVDETAQVARFASSREPRSLHRTGGWKWQWLLIPGYLWRGGVNDSAILSAAGFGVGKVLHCI